MYKQPQRNFNAQNDHKGLQTLLSVWVSWVLLSPGCMLTSQNNDKHIYYLLQEQMVLSCAFFSQQNACEVNKCRAGCNSINSIMMYCSSQTGYSFESLCFITYVYVFIKEDSSLERRPLVKELEQKHDRPHSATASGCDPSVSILWGQPLPPLMTPRTQTHMGALLRHCLSLYICLGTQNTHGNHQKGAQSLIREHACVSTS